MAKPALKVVHDDDLTASGLPRCRGIKANGERCGSFAGPRGFCMWHDPNIPEERKRAQHAAGGAATSRAARAQRMLPPRLRPVFDRLEQAMGDVVDGSLSPQRASALAALSSAAVRVLEAGEMEERLRKIESAAGDDPTDPTPRPYEDD
jgi:hypothetical protein